MPKSMQGDSAIVQALSAKPNGRYPAKFYWIDEPHWKDVRSLAGIVVGRKSDNLPLVQLQRFDGSPDGWPDMCTFRKVDIKQDNNTQSDGFDSASISDYGKEWRIDCSVYERAATAKGLQAIHGSAQ